MKYASVFLSVLFAWTAIILISLWIHQPVQTYQLYICAIVFTFGIFVIGFWRNR